VLPEQPSTSATSIGLRGIGANGCLGNRKVVLRSYLIAIFAVKVGHGSPKIDGERPFKQTRRPRVETPISNFSSGYYPGMSKLLLNLRDVPDDEADDVRRFLDSGGIGYYETRPSLWGISGGGIWIRDDRDVEEAKRLMAEYQRERQARAREERPAAPRNGTPAETFADVLRTQPLRVALTMIAIALLLALMAAPAMLLWR
jgi:hypothetical protein